MMTGREVLFKRIDRLIDYCEDESHYISEKPETFWHHLAAEEEVALTWEQTTHEGRRAIRATFTYYEILNDSMDEMCRRAMRIAEELMYQVKRIEEERKNYGKVQKETSGN